LALLNIFILSGIFHLHYKHCEMLLLKIVDKKNPSLKVATRGNSIIGTKIRETREDNNEICYRFIYTGHSVYKIPCGKAVNNIQNHRTNLVKFNQFFGHLLQKFPVQH